MQIILTINIPDDLAAYVKEAGPIEWGAVGPQTDEQHLSDFKGSLAKTRVHFSLEGDVELHGLYKKGTEVVMAHTGTSPNSSHRARVIDSLWNALYQELNSQLTPQSGETSGQGER